MGQLYKTRHGIDYWPVEMTDLNIDLLYGKKWRQLKERHGSLDRDPGDVYLSALKTLYGDAFKVSPWTEAHVHHWVKNEKPIFWGSSSCGKAVLLDEPLMFPDHVGTFREVKPGDEVMAATGRRVRVVGVYDQLDEPLYRVKFRNGTETICAGNHLWTVTYRGRVRWDGPRPSRKAVSGDVTRTLTAETLASWKPPSFSRRHVSVPLVSPVEFDERPVPLDPYVVGVLLGDGSLSRGGVQLTSHDDDVELRDEFVRSMRRTIPEFSLVKASGKLHYVMDCGGVRGKRTKLTAALDGLGLLDHGAPDKFVPEVYKINSVAVRMRVLAGLLDTDGTVDRAGRISFSTVSRALHEDVRFLFESIGARVTVYVKDSPKYHTSAGERKCGRRAFCITAAGLPSDTMRNLFFLSRKKDRVHARYLRTGKNYIESVMRVENRKDYPRETRCITISDRDASGAPTGGLFPIGHFVVTHNSNDVAACLVPHWLVEPYDTIVLVGSTTKDALRIRVWEAIERYFAVAKQYGKDNGFLIPGKITQTGYAVLNDRQSDDNPNAQGGKAGIHGVALNEGGKLQGAHLPSVAIVVDELATINNHKDILTTITNLLVADDFKFAAMANPEPWSNPSSEIYCTPVDGISSVSVDTREWETTFGAKVLHDDGFKSPCVLNPELAKEFPFLTRQKHLDEALRVAGGNADAPSFWKMARGFPTPVATGMPPVLDPTIAINMKVQEPGPPLDYSSIVATAAGIDPAWTEGGDGACRARVYVRRDAFGKMYLDFTGGLKRLQINAQDTKRPAVQQMRDQVLTIMREPFEASFATTAIDASANQGLADDLMIYAGANCLAINNSERASESPLRATDLNKPIRDTVYDRGTESWVVLAEFCKAGMVRGLPAEAVRALTMRTYDVNRDREGNVLNQKFPLRLEPKKLFRPRFKKSPDECDACANAALAVKERIGLLPFGYLVKAVDPHGFQISAMDTSPPPVTYPAESYSSVAEESGGGYDPD